jgi:hypothetical protein
MDSHDIFPPYDSQDLSSFTTFMIRGAASHLGLTHEGINLEDDIRAGIESVRPGIPAAIDQVIELYRSWSDGVKQGAPKETLARISEEIGRRRAEISAAVSN